MTLETIRFDRRTETVCVDGRRAGSLSHGGGGRWTWEAVDNGGREEFASRPEAMLWLADRFAGPVAVEYRPAPGEAALLAKAAAAAGTTVPAMLAAWLAAAVADNMPDALRRADGD